MGEGSACMCLILQYYCIYSSQRYVDLNGGGRQLRLQCHSLCEYFLLVCLENISLPFAKSVATCEACRKFRQTLSVVESELNENCIAVNGTHCMGIYKACV